MRIKVWTKAFIPSILLTTTSKELTWRSKFLALASEAGKEGSSFLPLLTYFPYLCAYATDNRSFSADANASARITTVVDIPDHRKQDVLIHRYSDPTHQVSRNFMSLIYGEEFHVQSKTSTPKGARVIEKTENGLNISFSSSGCNPFFQACNTSFAPSITMDFDLNFNFSNADRIAVELSGRVSKFPAFEAYLQIDDNTPITLFRHLPKKGNTPLNLLCGGTNIDVETSISLVPGIARPKPYISRESTVARTRNKLDQKSAYQL